MMDKNKLLKRMDFVGSILSAVVVILVVAMRKIKLDIDYDFSFLPGIYSTLNAITAMALILALYYIKQKNVAAHKNTIIFAMICSVSFLLLYVLYHITTPETKYCGEGSIRYLYFFLLITHIILAGVILPFIVYTFNRGYLMMVEKHKKLTRWVFPLWLYVAVTGPILYLMLYPCYK